MSYKKIGFIIPIFLVLLVCIPVVLPFFKTGFFPTHDGEWAVVRLADMFRTLKDFQFPARYSGALNFGYGYPLFNFAYPFPYYLGILFYFLLGSFVLSIKSIFVTSVFLSALFMYLASKELWKSRAAGIISSILYIYLPYRMVDLFVRGSLGESVSFALFPLILFLSLKLLTGKNFNFYIPILSLSVALLVMSHNIMTVLFLPILTTFFTIKVYLEKRINLLKPFLVSILLGLGLSSFFWGVALLEKSNILLSEIPIADRSLYFVDLKQIVLPSWGYSPPTENGGFSYQIGIANIIILFVIGLIFLLSRSSLRKQHGKDALLIFTLIIFCILMMFSFTSYIWENVPLLSEINYPWTLLSQIGFLISLLAGFLVLFGKKIYYLAIITSFLSIVLSINYIQPESYNDQGDIFYLTNEATTTSSNELMPLWVKEIPKKRFDEKVEILSGNATIDNTVYNSRKISFNYLAHDNSVFRVNTIYYPGWNAYINGNPIQINYKNDKGVMDITSEIGQGKVELIFTETAQRSVFNYISFISFGILIAYLIRGMREKLYAKKV